MIVIEACRAKAGEKLVIRAIRVNEKVADPETSVWGKLASLMKTDDLVKEFARQKELELLFHKRNWTFTAKSGEKVRMPPGYHAVVDGVVEQLDVDVVSLLLNG